MYAHGNSLNPLKSGHFFRLSGIFFYLKSNFSSQSPQIGAFLQTYFLSNKDIDENGVSIPSNRGISSDNGKRYNTETATLVSIPSNRGISSDLL